MRRCHIYTDEEKQFLTEFAYGHSRVEIAEAFTQKFGWEITTQQVKGCLKRYNLKTGRDGRFVKGQVSHNKGQKVSPEVYEKMKGTMFKKGSVPKNKKPVGSERVNIYGYVEIKVADPNKWRYKHKVIWEEHYGAIPPGHAVIFKDRNPLNLDISNLQMVTKEEVLIMVRNGLISEDAAITELGCTLAKLIKKTYELEGKRNAKEGRHDQMQ